jgi:hypothetical protein
MTLTLTLTLILGNISQCVRFKRRSAYGLGWRHVGEREREADLDGTELLECLNLSYEEILECRTDMEKGTRRRKRIGKFSIGPGVERLGEKEWGERGK